LTTRIECSQTLLTTTSQSRTTPRRKTGITLRVSPTQPQILAGKRADTTWGSNVFSLRHRLTCRSNSRRHAIALGERRSIPVRRQDLAAFFQDANYHDQIVKEQNKPTAMVSPPSRMKATPPRPAHDLFRHCCHGQRFDPEQIAIELFIPKRASTHDQLPEPYHDHCGIGLLGGREPHLQSYQAAAGIRRSRAIRREPIRRTVRKLALSDRPHDWGKVRRFPDERQAAVWISSISSFLG